MPIGKGRSPEMAIRSRGKPPDWNRQLRVHTVDGWTDGRMGVDEWSEWMNGVGRWTESVHIDGWAALSYYLVCDWTATNTK